MLLHTKGVDFCDAKCLGLGNRNLSFRSTLLGRIFHYTGPVSEINLEGNALVCLQYEVKE